MKQLKQFQRVFPSLLLAGAVALATASCEPAERTNDYRINHKIAVSKEIVSLTVKVPIGEAGMAGLELANFEKFARRFIDGGHGQLRIEAAAGNKAEEAAALEMRQKLLEAGVRANEIDLASGGVGNDAIVLSYDAYVAKAPECENWTANATFNWSNQTYSNFGCSVQRNLGQMVSDPRDLESAKPMAGADGERNAGTAGNYRKAAKGGGKQESAKGGTGK